MSRTITITDDMHRMLCGLIRSDVDPWYVIGADESSWDRLREVFPPDWYTDLPPDEDGVPNAGWGTAITTADDYEPGGES